MLEGEVVATTNDLFGMRERTQPAKPGSYGDAPRGFRLPDATRLGAVCLQVAELSRSLEFYTGALLFRIIERDAPRAVLGAHAGDTALVLLLEMRSARCAAAL